MGTNGMNGGLSLRKAAELVPTLDGIPARPALLQRWITRGVGGIRLNAKRVGRRYNVTREDVQTFLDSINEPLRMA